MFTATSVFRAARFSSAEIHTKLESKEKQDEYNWIRSAI